MPFADPAKRQHELNRAFILIVGKDDNAGIKERSCLESILIAEIGPDQQLAIVIDQGGFDQLIRNLVETTKDDCVNVAVAIAERGHHLIDVVAHLGLGKRKDAANDRSRPTMHAACETDWIIGCKGANDSPRRIWPEYQLEGLEHVVLGLPASRLAPAA
jgi:hypothetical protein